MFLYRLHLVCNAWVLMPAAIAPDAIYAQNFLLRCPISGKIREEKTFSHKFFINNLSTDHTIQKISDSLAGQSKKQPTKATLHP